MRECGAPVPSNAAPAKLARKHLPASPSPLQHGDGSPQSYW